MDTALILIGILIQVAIIILTLRMFVRYNELKLENKMLKKDLAEVFTAYTSLVRQIKEKVK